MLSIKIKLDFINIFIYLIYFLILMNILFLCFIYKLGLHI